MSGRHQGNTKEFRALTFAEQAKSITATINNLQAAIEHHINHSPQKQDTIDKCLAQIERLQQRLRSTYSVPVTPPLTLERLLEGVKDQNLHQEQDTGPAVGGEIW
jgi:hypothetical protein